MVAGRGQGKSFTAIRWLLEQPQDRVLITSDLSRRKHLLHVAERLVTRRMRDKHTFNRYVADRILPVATLTERFHLSVRSFASEVGIDDAEEVLRILFQARVELATFNATLIPVVGGMTVNGDFIDAEQTSVEARRSIPDKSWVEMEKGS